MSALPLAIEDDAIAEFLVANVLAEVNAELAAGGRAA